MIDFHPGHDWHSEDQSHAFRAKVCASLSQKVTAVRLEMTANEFFTEFGAALFAYDPASGIITAKRAPAHMFPSSDSFRVWKRHFREGRPCGHNNFGGYLKVRFLDKRILAHRLAWVLQTGALPEMGIDHLNGDGTDNRWANLRLASPQTNSRNQLLRSNNTSGAVGISKARSGRWAAYIANGKNRYIGTFDTIAQAQQARAAAERELGGFGPSHGKPRETQPSHDPQFGPPTRLLRRWAGVVGS